MNDSSRATLAGGVQAFAKLVDFQLRGIGQLMFQDHPLSGVLFLVGIFIHSIPLGLAALLGLCSSTITAYALGADRLLIRLGFFGFNGFYVGLGIAFYLGTHLVSWVCILLGGALAAILTLALMSLLRPWSLPPLTAPFIGTLCTVLLAGGGFEVLAGAFTPSSGGPALAAWGGHGPTEYLVLSVLRGIGQVFFQDSALAGAIFMVGIAIGSPAAAGLATVGSLCGVTTALALGASRVLILQGFYGYNSCLCALAVGHCFLGVSLRSAALGLMSALFATVLTVAIGVILAPWHLPVTSIPFTLSTWMFLLVEKHGLDKTR